MRFIITILLLIPYFGLTQSKDKSLSALLDKDWLIMKSVNIESNSDTVYNRNTGIKKWNFDSTRIYRLENSQIALVDGEGNIELGVADSITSNRFIVYVTFTGGFKCLYEYSNINHSKDKLSYTFRKWNYKTGSKERYLHYGYSTICETSKKKLPKPNIIQIEKSRKGNKISYEFTYDNGKPISDKEIKITVSLKGISIVTYVYTDSAGKATTYYPDYYFASNKHISISMQYGNLKSSAVLEQKYCPATLKRALTDKEDDTGNIRVMRDN